MNKKALMITAGIILALVGIFSYANANSFKDQALENKQEPETVIVHTTSALDLSDRNQLVGWADNVFVGKVVKKKGSKKLNTLPETQFAVEVKKNLKGELTGTIVVNQQGGYDEEEKKTYVIEHDKLLEEGKKYLFVTKHNKEQNFHTLVPEYGDLLIENDVKYNKLVKEFKTVSTKQVPFKIDPGPGPDTGNN
ncbi:hypothetical protein [uncultured Metabacillus sp.]|uniref:hypothetical protein n=1 Tax=uncultured Metabacillus sp. TaxID=2860135 RepID=UPI00262F6928|nr:hypothetical protein [uncultured Metabacillus sp.]